MASTGNGEHGQYGMPAPSEITALYAEAEAALAQMPTSSDGALQQLRDTAPERLVALRRTVLLASYRLRILAYQARIAELVEDVEGADSIGAGGSLATGTRVAAETTAKRCEHAAGAIWDCLTHAGLFREERLEETPTLKFPQQSDR